MAQLESFINHLKHCLACATGYIKIKHLAFGLDAIKALGFTLCSIHILAAHLVLYFHIAPTACNALTYTDNTLLNIIMLNNI